MPPVSSLVTALSASAAAGKNPWLPLAVILLLAQADTVPAWLMEPTLHRGLHGLGSPGLLLTLGVVFLVLSIADSLADKVGWIEAWLTPVSTTWRPFAAIAVAALIGVGTTHGMEGAGEGQLVALASGFGFNVGTGEAEEPVLSPAAWIALFIALGALAGLIATVGKTGTRLLLTLVPVPGVRVAHSFVDDLFAWGATLGGLVLGDSVLMAALGVAYLAVGLFTAPVLTRLTLIQLRIFISLWKKHTGSETQPPPPRWLKRALPDRDLSQRVPAYAYRMPNVGLFRSGFLIIDEHGVSFVVKGLLRVRRHHVGLSELQRIGLVETLTYRALTFAGASGGERALYLFPGTPAATSRRIIQAAAAAKLVRVRTGSASARFHIEGVQRLRYLPAARLGDLRLQGLLTVGAAIIGGVLTGGVWVPIGVGYLTSPFKGRFLVGLLLSGYLAASVLFSVGFFWPVAIVYAAVLNAVALRDLSRHALKAHLDGTVDTWSFLPNVPCAVWVPSAAPGDEFRESDPDPVTDGSWRVVWRLLSAAPAT
ncbi:MAG: DUF4126 domain-containing protein [Polyangiaceae bacterium]|nr:DUF4126 domain-containing protein [Polyangiaceae bacterium]MCW5789603.1 DUF4126 domain-containing protein [Polyangiaceae bacterium]